MLRPLLQILSPAGARARLSVLIFHRVHAAPDPLFPREPDSARFESLLVRVATWFNVLPLPDAIRMLYEGSLPARSLSISFDDGYADNWLVALPILRRLGLPATFFVVAGYLDGGRMWQDTVIESIRRASPASLDLTDLELGTHHLESLENRRQAIASLLRTLKYEPAERREAKAAAIMRCVGERLPDALMLTKLQVRELRGAGMSIGAHTLSHPILACEADDCARSEITGSKRALEALLGERVALFAYPNGKPGIDYSAKHVAMVRDAGFDAALSTAWGVASGDSDPFQIPRFTPWDQRAWRFGLRLARNLRRTAYATV